MIIRSIAATSRSAGVKVFARLEKCDDRENVDVTDAPLAAVYLTAGSCYPGGAPDRTIPEFSTSVIYASVAA